LEIFQNRFGLQVFLTSEENQVIKVFKEGMFEWYGRELHNLERIASLGRVGLATSLLKPCEMFRVIDCPLKGEKSLLLSPRGVSFAQSSDVRPYHFGVIARALQVIHRFVLIHCDLKPENLFLVTYCLIGFAYCYCFRDVTQDQLSMPLKRLQVRVPYFRQVQVPQCLLQTAPEP
jgi:hypothetical protein